MRVNVYAEELTDRVEIISKTTEAGTFTGLRFYLELPICVPSSGGHSVSHRGPFIHRPGDDDSSAVTFWGKQDMRKLLRDALAKLDLHYAQRAQRDSGAAVQSTPGQYEGNVGHSAKLVRTGGIADSQCRHGYDRDTCPVALTHPC